MWKETVFWFGLVPHLVVLEMELGMWSLCLVLEPEPSLGPNRYRGPCLPWTSSLVLLDAEPASLVAWHS